MAPRNKKRIKNPRAAKIYVMSKLRYRLRYRNCATFQPNLHKQKCDRMKNTKFDGLLFDLDGTLIDSSQVIDRAWGAFASKYGFAVDDILPKIQGKPAHESIAILRPTASRNDIAQDTKWLEEIESSDIEGVIALPGAVDLLNSLNNQQIPWAIVTSGTLPVATARINAARLPFPAVLVTPEQVKRGKPDPEPYILGATKLGLDVKKCVVFEDAPAGIQSGHQAGAKTVGLLTQFSALALQEKYADICITTLMEVTISSDGKQKMLSIKQ